MELLTGSAEGPDYTGQCLHHLDGKTHYWVLAMLFPDINNYTKHPTHNYLISINIC